MWHAKVQHLSATTLRELQDRQERIRIGAFLFGPFWAAYVRLWWLVAVWLGAVAVSFLISGEEFNVLDVGIVILMLVAVFKGEDWETARLEKRGYVEVGNVASAHDEGHASQCLPHEARGRGPYRAC